MVQRLGGHRPAMGPADQPAVVQLLQVPADRLGRHRELARQFRDPDGGLPFKTLEDQALAVGGQHAGILGEQADNAGIESPAELRQSED